MKRINKSSIYIWSSVISFFSCYALYKLYESILMVMDDRNAEIDNVSGVGLAMIFAPILLFMFNFVFYLLIYQQSVKKYPKQLSSWKILLLQKKAWRLNLLRILLYFVCSWTLIEMIGAEAAPMWVIITILVNNISYGYWVLQIVKERVVAKNSYWQ